MEARVALHIYDQRNWTYTYYVREGVGEGEGVGCVQSVTWALKTASRKS